MIAPVVITLTGDVVAKKNSKQIVPVRGRWIIVASKAFKKWHKNAMQQIVVMSPAPYVPRHLKIVEAVMKIYPSTVRKFDLSNMWESVADLLVESEVIEDDNWSVLSRTVQEFGGKDKENPRVEVTLFLEV